MYFRRLFCHIGISMNKKYQAIVYFAVATVAHAQEVPLSQTIFFDEEPQIKPELLLNHSKKDSIQVVLPPKNQDLESQVNFAIISKNWDKLTTLLDEYKDTPSMDPILYNYGLGALYRHNGRQAEAIKLYESIIQQQPNLYYPRFDLAMMLYENKQFNEAKSHLEVVEPYLSPQMQIIVNKVLQDIKKSQQWIYDVNFSYEKTDNVNQASDLKELVLGDAVFVRSEDSLPQKAHGIRYGLSSSMDKNIFGNHYLVADAELSGVHYWDNSDYSEITPNASLGYRFKDIKQTLGVTALVDKNFLGGEDYSTNYGGVLSYNRKLSNQLQVSGSYSHIQKNYTEDDLAKNYDGHLNAASLLLFYQPKLKWLLYVGADAIYDRLQDKSESSDKKGLRAGTVFSGDKFIVRTNLRYSERDFLDNNYLYNTKRKDEEYQLSTSIGHKDLVWNGFSPKINYEFKNIDSNLPLYERNDSTVFIEVNKSF